MNGREITKIELRVLKVIMFLHAFCLAINFFSFLVSKFFFSLYFLWLAKFCVKCPNNISSHMLYRAGTLMVNIHCRTSL